MEISFVIPVFNPGISFARNVLNLVDKFGNDCEVILVCDGVLLDLQSNFHSVKSQLKVINLPVNVGQDLATVIGFRVASFKQIVTIDDDFPVSIEELTSQISSDIERINSGDPSTLEKNWVTYLHQNKVSRGVIRGLFSFVAHKTLDHHPSHSSIRVVNLQVNVDYESLEYFLNVDDWLNYVGSHTLSENVDFMESDRPSSYTYASLIQKFFSIAHSKLPQILSFITLSVILVFFSITVLSGYYLIQYFFGDVRVDGFVTTILLLMWLSGAMLVVQLASTIIVTTLIQRLFNTETFNRTNFINGRCKNRS